MNWFQEKHSFSDTLEQEVKRSRKVRVYTNFGLALLLMIVWPFSLNNVTDGVEREAYFATYDAVLHYLDTREAPDPYAEFLEENQ
jgi:hypothetical protein